MFGECVGLAGVHGYVNDDPIREGGRWNRLTEQLDRGVEARSCPPPVIDLWIPGAPAPQGSKNLGRNRRTGRATMFESAGENLTVWRNTVKVLARQAFGPLPPLSGAVQVEMNFVLHRPVSLPKGRPTPPAVHKPDWDKIGRAVSDALTGTVYVDDAQIVAAYVTKRIADPGEDTGVALTVWGESRGYSAKHPDTITRAELRKTR